MKTLILFAFLSVLFPVHAVTWTPGHESSLQKNLTNLAVELPRQTAVIGRTGRSDTRVGVVIDENGHLLAPYLPAIDQKEKPYEKNEAPYLLYREDGTRVPLTTVVERPKRAIALLKMDPPVEGLAPVRISSLSDHTVVLPTCSPIATLGEPVGLYVDHLETEPEEDDTSFRLDSVFPGPGTPILDTSGALIGTTLRSRPTHTTALMISKLILEIEELDAVVAEETTSDLPSLPLAPKLDREELKDLSISPLTQARQRYLQSTHPSPSPFVLVSNENTTQATHSAIGTIVGTNGLIITKASELGPVFQVRYNGQSYPGVLLSTDEETDLALIGISASNMPEVRWFDELPDAGATVASPVLLQESTEDMVSEPTSFVGSFGYRRKGGVTTVHATSEVTSLGLTSEQVDSGLIIAAIAEDTPAYESGLSPGDVITRIDETKITARSDLTDFLNRSEVGQKVVVHVEQSGKAQQFEVELIAPRLKPPDTGLSLEQGISMIPSVRRSPFPEIMVHTTPLNAWDCGSPLFDLQGRAIGLNIAAVAPARSIALPPSVIRQALRRLLTETRAF